MSATHITIAIITYQRPNSLKITLEAIATLVVPENSKLSVLVVDNDVSQSAAPIVKALAGFPFPLYYAVQPQKGRGFARNTALDETRDEDYLAFIDDDVQVAPYWLSALLRCCAHHQAQFCGGNLRYLCSGDAPRWISDCRLLRSKATSKPVTSVATGNLLMDRQWIAGQGLRFPLVAVGEDIFFTYEAYHRGATIMTCIEAHASTHIESNRMNIHWVLHRAMHNGANRYIVYRHLYGHGPAIVISCFYATKMTIFAVGAAVLASGGDHGFWWWSMVAWQWDILQECSQ